MARGRSPTSLGHEAAGKQAGECVRPAGSVRGPSMGLAAIILDGVLRALTWKPARFSTSYNQNRRRSCSRAQLTAGGVTDEDTVRLIFFAVCIAALAPIGMLTAQAKADQGMPCFAVKGARTLVLAPDRRTKMLVRRQDRDLEITAEVARGGAAQAKVKVAPPVSVVTEKRSEPMNAQARMLDDDGFESRWRARVSTE